MTMGGADKDAVGLFAVQEFLADLIRRGKFDKEQLEVALQVLEELAPRPAGDSSVSLAARGLELQDVVYSCLQNSAPKETSKASSEESERSQYSPAFVKYLERLKESGFFNGTEEGSPEFALRAQKALEKWRLKYGSEVKAEEASASLSQAYIEKAEKLKEEGNQKLSAKDIDGAIDCYSSAILLNPSNPIFFSNRAAAYIKAGDFEKACDDRYVTVFSYFVDSVL